MDPLVVMSEHLVYREAKELSAALNRLWNDEKKCPSNGPIPTFPSQANLYRLPTGAGTLAVERRRRIKEILKYLAEEERSGVSVDLKYLYSIVDAAEGGRAGKDTNGFRPLNDRDKAYIYLYTVHSYMFLDDVAEGVDSKWTAGYFIVEVDSIGSMTVMYSGTWYQHRDDGIRLDHSNKRGDWKAYYVGVSHNDVVIVYDFNFSNNHREHETYKGLLTAKRARGIRPVFSQGESFSGKFCAVNPPSKYSGEKDGDMYIELFEVLDLDEFSYEATQGKIRRAMRDHSAEMWSKLDVLRGGNGADPS